MKNADGNRLVGVIADTHGLVRPEAVAALRGVDLILHAGDIGKPEVIEKLETIAPVTAIRGNIDTGDWAEGFPDSRVMEIGGLSLFMLHNLKEIGSAEGFDVVVSGHSHKPVIESRGGILFVNPGSAGPRRFRLPVCIAHLTVAGGRADAQIIELSV